MPKFAAQLSKMRPDGSVEVLPSIQSVEDYFDMLMNGLADIVLTYESPALQPKVLTPVIGRHTARLHTVFESPLAESLRRAALEGLGIAWLPVHLVADDLAQGTLRRLPGEALAPHVSIVAYRLKTPRSDLVEVLWNVLSGSESTR